MQIIKYTKKGSNKYELTLKDNTKLLVYTDLILEYNLLIRKNLDTNTLKEIKSANLKLECYYKTLKYLKNTKCTSDIKNYLKDYPSNIVDYTVQRLTKEGYLNDNISNDTSTITSDELIEKLKNDYPFKFDFAISNSIIDAEIGESLYTVDAKWPFESGDDELDTKWGKLAYDYKKNYPDKPSIELKVKIYISQITEETSG